ncbi:D-Ala-D-Ala carboxypeptidase family metallohydrolase [Fibrivirga algicola]|uniref:Peptidase M15 n=1 Tax=Fibrivirga algicola TaxID=2950420 RepID=A0ABX0QGY2_9BACT|nr:D-Ala-D-Ala carboxypeptidase family metallohydrolase [Fibrivirga algicola]NID09359.1 peptidase M15 [Fibrivirga algicola]
MSKQSFPDFGPWLTYAEAIRSDTARRKGIANVPTAAQYARMKAVYDNIYAPLCKRFGKLPVSSFFRCAELNKAVGGSKTSQHMVGAAIDIDCDGIKVIGNKALHAYIKANMSFDQLGLEYPDANGNPGWVHVSFVSLVENRKALFTAT